ncbi:Transposase [Cordylochernes scorpioides]|uniref:Transposase n=1 Tax=Cordylochernes scorpioides TaxID=51811 RepID=A0ABY6KRX3_9ARAC|nr:Transposase [Cordylochernes scorpioides]
MSRKTSPRTTEVRRSNAQKDLPEDHKGQKKQCPERPLRGPQRLEESKSKTSPRTTEVRRSNAQKDLPEDHKGQKKQCPERPPRGPQSNIKIPSIKYDCQSLDGGIIKSFKAQYRKLQLQKMVELADAHLPTELRLDYAVRYFEPLNYGNLLDRIRDIFAITPENLMIEREFQLVDDSQEAEMPVTGWWHHQKFQSSISQASTPENGGIGGCPSTHRITSGLRCALLKWGNWRMPIYPQNYVWITLFAIVKWLGILLGNCWNHTGIRFTSTAAVEPLNYGNLLDRIRDIFAITPENLMTEREFQLVDDSQEAEMKLTDDNFLVSTVTAKEELGEDDDATVTPCLPSLREARTAAETVLLFLEHSKRATSDDVNLSAEIPILFSYDSLPSSSFPLSTVIMWHHSCCLSPSHDDTKTISRRLVANGLHSCRPLRRLPLTPPNRRQRLEWCRARSTWTTEWHRVVFSDESRFFLSSDSRRVRVWRRRGERSNPAAIVERPTVRQRGIMVWGAIAYDSRSPLLRIQGTMTAQRYVDDVLRPVTLPYLQGVPNALYQQDNARPHTARISQQALQDVQMLPWPPYSPDLSPIEHVWDITGRGLHALPQPRSEDELWQMVEREWRGIPQDAIRTLIGSLPRRVAACIAVRGGPTCY